MANEQDTSDKDRSEWSVRCYTVLKPSFGYLACWKTHLYDLFLVFLLTGPSSSSTVVPFSQLCTRIDLQLYVWSVLCISQVFLVKCPVFPFCSFFFENSISILCKPYSLSWCKFIFTALSLLLNDMLQRRYFVTALKAIIHNNIVRFCFQMLAIHLSKTKYSNFSM